jgi:CheY-like chemotaxis protein
MNILLAESDSRLADVYADFLRGLGHDVRLVSGASAALDQIQSWPPDVVIFDMAVTSTERSLLEHPVVQASGIPIIAVVAGATERLGRECLRLGAVDFLPKPVSFERLSAIVSWLEIYAVEGGDRRRLPRAEAHIPMRVRAETQWTSLDLSPVGVKMPPQAWIEPGATVSLLFALPDGGAPLHLKAMLSRAEPDGHIFTFVNLSDAEFKRLADYSRSAAAPVTVRPAQTAMSVLTAD